MAASRTMAARPLKQLTSRAARDCRQLHMTFSPVASQMGVATSSEKTSDQTRSTNEGRRRSFSTSGSSAEPVVTRSTTTKPIPLIQSEQTRHFNTTRALKSPKDSSFIDFAFLPTEPLAESFSTPSIRVPLLPQNFTPFRTGAHAHPTADFDKVERIEITTAAADSTHINVPSAMSDVHDNNAMAVDFHEIAEKLEGVVEDAKEMGREVGKGEPGVVRQLWDGMVDDVLGRKTKGGLA